MKEEKRDHKIYKYTNRINGKIYIGRTCQTLSLRARREGKGYKECPHFYRAIQKYGWENFEGIILEDNLTDEEATQRETYYINDLNSNDPEIGYNLTDSSQNYSGSTRRKMGQFRKGKKLSKEHKEKISQGNKGKVLSEETRKRISENHADVSGENNPMWGKHRSKELKEKLREINTGKVHSDSTRKKLSDLHRGRTPWNKGKKLTEEQKKNMKKPNNASKKGVICIETGIKYESLEYASKCTNINPQKISFACRGLKETAGGFHWKWEIDPANFVFGRKVRCLETGVEYPSIKIAAEKVGVSRSALSEALRRHTVTGGGHWEYVAK